jgi:hypothetical protein
MPRINRRVVLLNAVGDSGISAILISDSVKLLCNDSSSSSDSFLEDGVNGKMLAAVKYAGYSMLFYVHCPDECLASSCDLGFF